MRKKKFIYTVRRASLKERLHFLLTGKIPNYWGKILSDFSITMIQALNDPDFPLYKDNPGFRKEFLNFFSTFRPTYKYMEKWICRKWNLFPEDKKRNNSSEPDYFPDLFVEITTSDGKDRTEEQRFNDIVEFYKNNYGHKNKVPEKEIRTYKEETDEGFLFTVNDSGKKIKFAPGNLYWNGNKFCFEEHQYDYPIEQDSSHIGFFSWNKDASKAINPGYRDLDAQVYDKLFATDGGAIEGWTVLSKNEWDYLFKHALAKTHINTFRGTYDPIIKIAGKNCIVLKPDGFQGTLKRDYTADEWAVAEAIAGLVALPLAGCFGRDGIRRSDIIGNYLSSTPSDTIPSNAYKAGFDSSGAITTDLCRYYGDSIRLVQVQQSSE